MEDVIGTRWRANWWLVWFSVCGRVLLPSRDPELVQEPEMVLYRLEFSRGWKVCAIAAFDANVKALGIALCCARKRVVSEQTVLIGRHVVRIAQL